jgi:hypothetical protein
MCDQAAAKAKMMGQPSMDMQQPYMQQPGQFSMGAPRTLMNPGFMQPQQLPPNMMTGSTSGSYMDPSNPSPVSAGDPFSPNGIPAPQSGGSMLGNFTPQQQYTGPMAGGQPMSPEDILLAQMKAAGKYGAR